MRLLGRMRILRSRLMPDLDTRIAEIAGRAEAATSEEWRSLTIYPARAEVLTGETHQKIAVLKGEHCYEDADFIANARSDIPFLLAALQQAREALREIADGSGGSYQHVDTLREIARAALAPEQTKGAG